MIGSNCLTEKQKKELGIPGIETVDDILRILPESISVGKYSFGFIFGNDGGEYYAGYKRYETYLRDYVSRSKDLLECLYNLLMYVMKKSKQAY